MPTTTLFAGRPSFRLKLFELFLGESVVLLQSGYGRADVNAVTDSVADRTTLFITSPGRRVLHVFERNCLELALALTPAHPVV